MYEIAESIGVSTPDAVLQTFGVSGVNRLHYRVWQIVRGCGGIPQTGKGTFWVRISRQLREEGNDPGPWHLASDSEGIPRD
jgi:hypothetical protein